MTRYKREQIDKQIYALLYLFIEKRGYFNDYWDYDVFDNVARTLNCSFHQVKKVYWKKFEPENHNWIQNFSY